MIHEPRIFAIARLVVLLLLASIFLIVIKFNIDKFTQPPTSQHLISTSQPSAPLPVFSVLPADNHTVIQTLDCTFGDSLDIRPYVIRQRMPDRKRTARQRVWEMYQLALATEWLDAEDFESTDAYVEALATLGHDEYRRIHGHEAQLDMAQFKQLYASHGSVSNDTLSKERWGAYTVEQSTTKDDDDDDDDDDKAQMEMTCVIGSLVRVQASNATVLQPTLAGRWNTSVAGHVVTGTDYSSSRRIPLFSGQHTVITYSVQQECREEFVWTSLLTYTKARNCTSRHDVAIVTMMPLSDGASVPPAIRNRATNPNAAFVTVQLNTNTNGEVPITTVNYERTYGYLEVAASTFSAFSILLLMYRLLMGHSRIDPFGWVHKTVLRPWTKRFVHKVRTEHEEQEWLEHVLFTWYLKGHGLSDAHGKRHGLKAALNKLKRRWSDATLVTSQPAYKFHV